MWRLESQRSNQALTSSGRSSVRCTETTMKSASIAACAACQPISASLKYLNRHQVMSKSNSRLNFSAKAPHGMRDAKTRAITQFWEMLSRESYEHYSQNSQIITISQPNLTPSPTCSQTAPSPFCHHFVRALFSPLCHTFRAMFSLQKLLGAGRITPLRRCNQIVT